MSIIMIVNVDFIYPVGSIYITTSSISPATLFGGTWERLQGRYLYATDGSSYTYSSSTGTSTEGHGLTENEMPSHNHGMQVAGTKLNTEGNNLGFRSNTQAGSGDFWNMSLQRTNGGSHNGSITNTGGNQPHSHNIPYFAVFVYRRTS